jgi:nitroreductase
MEFYEVIKTRRSIRRYKKEPVPSESLNRILNSARLAPSGSNRQKWKYYVVNNQFIIEKLASACGGQSWIAQAPTVIVATGWRVGYNRGGYMGEMSFIMDIAISFTHLILAARAENLGTCWIGDFNNNEVKKILGIKGDEEVVAVTPLGYPEGIWFNEVTNRKQMEDVVEEIR